MKNLLLTIAIAFMSTAAFSQSAPNECLTNGDISQVSSGKPVDWVASGNKADVSYDATVGRTAPGSLKLVSSEAGWRSWQHLDIPVEEGETYILSVYVKTENVEKGTSRVRFTFGVKGKTREEFIVRDNDVTTQKLVEDKTKGTHDWMLIEGRYTIPEGGAYISYLRPRLDTKGATSQSVWFDDFSIVKVQK